jgi:hypothetical protein
MESLQAAVQSILKKRHVEGLLEVTYLQEMELRHVRQYGDRPGRTEERKRYVVQVRRNPEATTTTRCLLGWRLYATNAPAEELPLVQGVWVYRGAPRIERDFQRLKERPLALLGLSASIYENLALWVEPIPP